MEQWPRLYANGRHSWENIHNKGVRNVMAAKMYKMLMFLLPELQGVQVILWCDADKLDQLHNLDTLYSHAADVLNGTVLAIERHPDRDTVKAELMPAARRVRQ